MVGGYRDRGRGTSLALCGGSALSELIQDGVSPGGSRLVAIIVIDHRSCIHFLIQPHTCLPSGSSTSLSVPARNSIEEG